MSLKHFPALLLLPLVVMGLSVTAPAQMPDPVAKWTFDESKGPIVHDSVSHDETQIKGIYKRVAGVSGNALRFDGNTTSLIKSAETSPQLNGSFSLEAWIAINTYPWNWVPIADQRRDERAGYFFGIDGYGHLGFQVAVNGIWRSLTSTSQIELKKWTHVVASFDGSRGLSIFVNGSLAGELAVQGTMSPPDDEQLIVGRVREETLPALWLHPKLPVWYSFDGLIDELSIYNQSLTSQQVTKQYSALRPANLNALPWPVFPSGPPGPGPFGAYYATLKYDELWEAPRRVGRDSDVVVRFDDLPIRFVFWQGTNYIPAWVTENGKWYTDAFMETWGRGCPYGEDCEPMSDRQNRYTHVRILESSPARAVVHFRYGLCEVEQYICANPDEATGWPDWADEYYTIYPDGSAVRKQVMWTSKFAQERTGREFQESIVIDTPGTRPEDNINTDALTLANLNGETATYSWASQVPKKFDRPQNPNIQVVNLKSSWKPFQIVAPEKAKVKPYDERNPFSIFAWWNHWPVAQVISSGINATAPDKPAHSSLSHIEGQPIAMTDNSVTKLMLAGLTTQSATDLVPLAKSWLSPPVIKLSSDSFRSEGYDPTQRAFVLTRTAAGGTGALHATLEASAQSPLVNPAVVIENWGDSIPQLKLNGKPVSWGTDFRVGLITMLERSRLVIWMKMRAVEQITIDLVPINK